MHYHRMNILVRLILYRMKKQRNFENAEMLSHISDHNHIGMSEKILGPLNGTLTEIFLSFIYNTVEKILRIKIWM